MTQLLQYLEGKYANAIVDLVGFDHRFIYETNEKSFFDNSDFVQSFINIESQRLLTPQLKDFFKKLTLRFISYDEFADIDPKTGNHFQQSTSNVEIVGEITTNHFGDTERLIHLIKSASKAGVDAVKFQIRQVDTFYTKQKLKEPQQNQYRGEYDSTSLVRWFRAAAPYIHLFKNKLFVTSISKKNFSTDFR